MTVLLFPVGTSSQPLFQGRLNCCTASVRRSGRADARYGKSFAFSVDAAQLAASFITGYSNATPSGSCSASQRRSIFTCEHLEMVLIANLRAGVDVNPDGHA